jgi:hypothetical protein
MRIPGAVPLGVLLLAVVACSERNPVGPGTDPFCEPSARVVGGDRSYFPPLLQLSATAALSPLQGVTLGAPELPGGISLPEDGATYVMVPHFATGTGPNSSISYEVASTTVGGQASVIATRKGTASLASVGGTESLQRRFDAALRTAEGRLAQGAGEAVARWRVSANVTPSAAVAAPKPGTTRSFKVLASLDPNSTKFDDVTATLRFTGCNILIYVDQAAPAAPKGFSDAQLDAIGRLFDRDLYELNVSTFGTPSDIDGNGRVIVLLTPTVNRLTPSSQCRTGYVSGFFYGLDLRPDLQNSNKGEIFYALVPDPDGSFSCAHPVERIESTTPTTFVHELQHMISWNQHVTVRRGRDEALWLNEGLSHIAEELTARHYEDKFPPPAGRTNPRQIFPDSAARFITGVLFDSYSYLLEPWRWSITQFADGGTIQERGGVWLFLRWLGDQKGNDIYGKLVQTSLTGIANVEAQAGEKFPALFGDFTLAVYTDSLPGVARSSIPQRYRFASRNLRMLFDALYRANNDRTQFPRPFPLESKTIAGPGGQSAEMLPGTFDVFRVQTSTSESGSQSLSFTRQGGSGFDAALRAQVTLFRCPSPAACPATITQ